MNVLIAEDDVVGRMTLQAMLAAAGYQVTSTSDGREALDAWRLTAARVVISDWMMPEMDGLELCRRIRDDRSSLLYTYFILLTGRGGKESFLTAMESGIDDFITKPVDAEELKARLGVAQRILGMRQRIDALEGLLPICSYCKRIRNETDQWSELEGYIETRSKAEFSHGICPDCFRTRVEPKLT